MLLEICKLVTATNKNKMEVPLKGKKFSYQIIWQTHYWAYNPRRPELKWHRHPKVYCSNIYNIYMEATKMSIDT